MAVPRIALRRAMIGIAALSFALVVIRWFRLLQGGALPVARLKLGMTKAEVRAAVGAPQSESPDASSWVVTRPGSLYWLEIEFDANDRLKSFKAESF